MLSCLLCLHDEPSSLLTSLILPFPPFSFFARPTMHPIDRLTAFTRPLLQPVGYPREPLPINVENTLHNGSTNWRQVNPCSCSSAVMNSQSFCKCNSCGLYSLLCCSFIACAWSKPWLFAGPFILHALVVLQFGSKGPSANK